MWILCFSYAIAIQFDLLETTIIALRGELGKKVSEAKDIADLDMNLERMTVFYRDFQQFLMTSKEV